MKMKRLNSPLEIKALSDKGEFEGYGSVFGVVDSYRDVVVEGAFKSTIAEHKKAGTMPALLWQHNTTEPIGIYTEIKEDNHGLFMKGELFVDSNVPLADTAYTLLKRGGVGGMSIGYSIPKGGSEFDDDKDVLNLIEVKLWETSIVTFPANPVATVTDVRMGNDYMDLREFEILLKREAGFTRQQVQIIVNEGYKSITREADGLDTELLERLNQINRYKS